MAYSINEPIHVKKAVINELQLAFWAAIRNNYPAIGENANIRIQELSYAVDELVMTVNTWILDGHKVDILEPTTIDFPATVWDHWKLKYGPKWLVRRWPVEFKEKQVTKHIHQHYVCPHINIKSDDHKHIMWMYENSGQNK